MGDLLSFAAHAEAANYTIRPEIPRSRSHLPPLSIWVDVYSPEDDHLGVGIVIAHDDDPEYLRVRLNGETLTVHYSEVDWAKLGGDVA